VFFRTSHEESIIDSENEKLKGITIRKLQSLHKNLTKLINQSKHWLSTALIRFYFVKNRDNLDSVDIRLMNGRSDPEE